VSLRDVIRRWLSPEPEPVPHDRHARREAARERHAAGGPGWSEEDRVPEESSTEVADLDPTWAGTGSSHRRARRS
jgi:hypothetical protein